MVSGPFYIYGGGRWREINLDDATIKGWGRAKFAYAKDGKLVLTKNSGVLAALRNLKSGYKSAARDGARLPHKHRNVTCKRGERKRYLDNSKCDCSHCCHQSNTHRGHNLTVEQSEVKQTTVTVTQSVQRIDTAIQTSPQSSVCDISDTVKKKIHKKHNKCSHSHNNEPTKKSTTAMVNSTPKKLASLKLKKQWSLVDSDKVWPKKKLPIIKLNKEDSTKYNLYKRMGDNNEEVWVVLPKTHDKDGKITNKRYNNDSASSKSSQDSLPQITKKAKTLKGIVSSSKINCVEKNNRNPPKIQKSNNESNDNDPVSKFQLDSRPISNLEKEYLASQNKIKELVIDEDDIMMLRDFLMKNATDFNLLKFDEDLDYRTQFLFAINPVVSLERCPEINRMLRRDSQSEISLKDFASQLGLTSISEKNSPKRYKMRKRNSHEDTNISENDINKEMKKKNKKYFEETERDSDVVKDKRSLNKKSNDSGRAQDSRTPVRRKRRRTESQILSDFEEKKVADSLNLRSRANNNVTTPINFKTNDIYLSEETTTTTSEEDYSNRDSSTDEIVNARVFRKRNTEKIDKVNLITSDSADSIGITESEHLNKNLTKTTTELNVDIKSKETNTENKLTKINNCAGTNDSKQTDNYTVSKDKNVKITMTPLKRNKRGRFIKRRNTTRTENNNEENHYSKEDLNTGDKSKSNNSDEQFATNKDSRSTRKIHLLNEKSESKSKPKNNINGVENNINDRSNSMTNTNDDSESENYELKSDSRMKNVQNKLQNEKTVNNETKCHTSESDGFIRPIIGEIRSLAVEVRRDEERPPSSAASLRVEYSNLEDQAIVAWVSVGGRARAVNGNVIWKELQESYYKIAGQHRTWHSLRNRYLRSILPRLGQLALDPGQESRLRAAAHTGVFKGQKLESRRNSIFGPPPAAGALSRPRPRRSTTRSPTSEEERPPKRLKPEHTHALHSPPRRELRSSHSSPNKVERTPRFSEIIRRFADKLDTSDSTVRSSLRQSSQHREQRNSPQRNGTSDSESSHENLLKVRKSKILETRNMSKNLSKSRNSSKNLSKSGKLSDTRNSSKNLSETRNSSKDASSLSEKKTSKKSLPAKEPATRSHKKGGKTARKLFNPNSGRKL